MLRNRSGNIPEQWLRKPGTHLGSFPYPEVELSVRQASNSADSDQEETSDRIVSQFFSLYPFIKSTESTDSEFKSHHRK